LRPVSRSAQPKVRGEHVVHQEHGPAHLSHPVVSSNTRIPESPFANVERRPRKGRSEKNLSRRATDTVIDHPRRKSRGSSAHLEVSDRANQHSKNRHIGVCRRFASLTLDRSLWHVIQLHRHQHLTNTALACIGRLRPRELRLTYCRGDNIGEEGLRCLFQGCGTGLRKLSFIGCTKGPFDRDIPLLLAADYCPNLSHVNASYTQAVRDQTVMALAKSAFHLISVKLNGAQQISNAAIQQLVHYHKDTLQRLELFGCFRLNSDIFKLLGSCQELRALAFGHLHHLSSDGLLELVGKGEVGIAQMLRRLPRLRVLDLCGLSAVGDMTMEALAQSCPHLEDLDVSCTSVTQNGLLHLAQVPATCLRCLRISHCREITKDVLEKLIKACPKQVAFMFSLFISD
uniref:F-box and leucine rich repeat protein 7 n=1 Tax=Echinostoma caproni TaxID=27848 RepID=A0A183AM13_9TREM